MSMSDKELEEKIKALTLLERQELMTIEDMATIQPGLARIMPEVGARTWKLYYAAKAQNWPMAKFQYKEIQRPDGARRLHASEARGGAEPVPGRELEAARGADREARTSPPSRRPSTSAIDMANAYHELKEKPYIRWKLPDAPPPDMDLTPRGPKG